MSRWIRPVLVRGVQCVGDLLDDRDGERRAERLLGLGEHRAQIAALDQPHVQIQPAVDLTEPVDRHHVRVVDARGGLRLAAEPRLERLVDGHVVRQHLERDDPVGLGVVGLVDLTHPALADQLLELIVPEWCRIHRLSPRLRPVGCRSKLHHVCRGCPDACQSTDDWLPVSDVRCVCDDRTACLPVRECCIFTTVRRSDGRSRQPQLCGNDARLGGGDVQVRVRLFAVVCGARKLAPSGRLPLSRPYAAKCPPELRIFRAQCLRVGGAWTATSGGNQRRREGAQSRNISRAIADVLEEASRAAAGSGASSGADLGRIGDRPVARSRRRSVDAAGPRGGLHARAAAPVSVQRAPARTSGISNRSHGNSPHPSSGSRCFAT